LRIPLAIYGGRGYNRGSQEEIGTNAETAVQTPPHKKRTTGIGSFLLTPRPAPAIMDYIKDNDAILLITVCLIMGTFLACLANALS
jgi:hypothetical protein